MSFEPLIEKIKAKNNPTVMGLDPVLDYIPAHIRDKAAAEFGDTFKAAGEAILEFNKGLIDAAADLIPAVKPQSAFYEMYGIEGLIALEKTIEYAKAAGLYVILDVKRNDIGSTAEAYAKAFIGETQLFTGKAKATPVDCVTVNPYLGIDGVKPFIDTAAKHDKSMFILVKTSNKSSGDFQDLEIGDTTLYRKVGAKVEEWGAPYISESGYSPCGAVVGATYPKQLTELRAAMPHTFFLIPGYGAQGGAANDIVGAFDANKSGAIVNSSRALMCAYKKANDDGTNFKACTRDAVIAMRDDINSVL
ncbi:MAG: orotidine-5'-phosphate decarboxylase [Ruminococcaceae bacterium]|nr:orotidine-5'-phosphate decarboxylase [Oscillospiraceae bacterium]